jgi:cytochrome c oxidase subunit 2
MKQHVLSICAAAGLLWSALNAVGCGVSGRGSTASGQTLYEACNSCHGDSGEGNATLGAPRIAGLPKWYIASQVERFQSGLRGKHFDDVEGLKMRAMAKQLMSKAEIDAVSAYAAGLPAVISAPTLSHTNLETAQATYAACGACHGLKGEGSEPQSSPPLAGLDDWYLARQLRKFQTGVRGTAKDDLLGPQMAAMAQAVTPAEVDNMAAYLHGLGK